VEALTPRAANFDRKAVISGSPISCGWRVPLDTMKRRIHATYA